MLYCWGFYVTVKPLAQILMACGPFLAWSLCQDKSDCRVLVQVDRMKEVVISTKAKKDQLPEQEHLISQASVLL